MGAPLDDLIDRGRLVVLLLVIGRHGCDPIVKCHKLGRRCRISESRPPEVEAHLAPVSRERGNESLAHGAGVELEDADIGRRKTPVE